MNFTGTKVRPKVVIFALTAQSALLQDMLMERAPAMHQVARHIDPGYQETAMGGQHRQLSAPYKIHSLDLRMETLNGRDLRVEWRNLHWDYLRTAEWRSVIPYMLQCMGFPKGHLSIGVMESRDSATFSLRHGSYIVALGAMTRQGTTLTLNMPWFRPPGKLPEPRFTVQELQLKAARAANTNDALLTEFGVATSLFIAGDFGVPRHERWRSEEAQQRTAKGEVLPLYIWQAHHQEGEARVVINAVTGEVYFEIPFYYHAGLTSIPLPFKPTNPWWSEANTPLLLKSSKDRVVWRSAEFLRQGPWLVQVAINAERTHVHLSGKTYRVANGPLPKPKPKP